LNYSNYQIIITLKIGQLASKDSESYLKSYLESQLEYNFEFKREPYKLFEWTHYKNLKKGQTYFAIFESYEFQAVFKSYYNYRFHHECDYYDSCDAILVDDKHSYLMDIHWQFYRVITEKEYMTKVRDKYDETVLNIVLKRLVNEEFIW
jgi:hypothetical protein